MILRAVIGLIVGIVCGALNNAACFALDVSRSTGTTSVFLGPSSNLWPLLALMGAIFGAMAGAVLGLIIGISGVNRVWGAGMGFITGVVMTGGLFEAYFRSSSPDEPLPIGLILSLFGWALTGFIVAAVTRRFSVKKLA